MKSVNFLPGACLAILVMAGAAGASTRSQGTYDVYQGGVRVGTDRFAWEDSGQGRTILKGDCVLEMDGVSTTKKPALTLNTGTFKPMSFDLTEIAGEETRQVSAQFDGSRAELVTRENGMQSKQNLKINPADLVIENDVLHLYLVLARLYDFEKAGEQNLTVFDVSAKKAYTAHCMLRGLGTFENSSGKFRARRLTINLEDAAVDLLVDSQGQVPLISIPLRQLEARMAGYEGGDRAEFINK